MTGTLSRTGIGAFTKTGTYDIVIDIELDCVGLAPTSIIKPTVPSITIYEIGLP